MTPIELPRLSSPEPLPGVRETIAAALSAAVPNVLEGINGTREARRKESLASVVTDTDLRVEAAILAALQERFPEHAFLAEESGLTPGDGRWTWIIDPLDGTSNFAAGLPWFAVMVALVEAGELVAAGIALPAMGDLYYAERGAGAWRNGQRIQVSTEPELANLLVAYGLDWQGDAAQTADEAQAIGRLVAAARNLRATNCALDDCFVADGRFGAAVNQNMKLWDLAAPALLVTEAGGRVTDLAGRPHDLRVTPESVGGTYARVAAPPQVHAGVLRVVRG